MAVAIVAVIAVVVGMVLWKVSSRGSDAAPDNVRPPAQIKAPALNSAPTNVRWSYTPEDSPTSYLKVVGGDSKTVLVGLRSYLVALDAANGSQVWKQPLPRALGDVFDCVLGTSGSVALCGGDRGAVFMDAKTGALVGDPVDLAHPDVYSGSGLLAVADNRTGITVFDDSGKQLWQKSQTGYLGVFLDQRIVVVRERAQTQFFDARTGDELFSTDFANGVLATSHGIVVAQNDKSFGAGRDRSPRQQIDFYSFTGELLSSISKDRGYRLPDTDPIPGSAFAVPILHSTSGVSVPVIYQPDTGEVAGVDVTTGDILWSQQVAITPDTNVTLFGVDNLCVLSLRDDGQLDARVRARNCNEGEGAVFTDPDPDSDNHLIVADGEHILLGGLLGATAYDAVTGKASWRVGKDLSPIEWAGDGLYAVGIYAVSRLS